MSLRSSFFSARAVAITFAAGAFFGMTATGLTAAMLGSAIFPDVPSGSYYDAAVGRLQESGIMKGSNGEFRPGDYVTRAELATVIDRVINGGEVSVPRALSSSRSRSSAAASSSSSVQATATDAGSVHFTTGTFSISDKAGSLTVSVIRSGGSKGAVTVNYDFSGGTAVAAKHYNPASGTISFKEGETSKTITLRVLTTTEAGPPVTANVTLSAPTGGLVLSSPSSAVVTIINSTGSSGGQSSSATYTSASSAPGGTFSLGALGYAAEEKTGSIVVTVKRTGNSSSAVGVDYATADGTGTASTNYGATKGTVSFAAGESTKTISIPLIDNSGIDGNKSFSFTLKTPTGGANIGYPATATITAIDDEVASSGSGTLQFSTDAYVAGESDGNATIIVNRIGGTVGSVNVSYATQDSTATAASDYTATSGTLTFAAGESIKFFVVPILKDSVIEDEERVTIVLSSPTGGATLGTIPSTTLKIR